MKEKIRNLFRSEHPISVVQILLTVFFVATLLISNIISARTFNFFGFSMTAAVIVFPVTYILSDLFSEVYGYKWSRITCYLAFTINLMAVGIFYLVSALPVIASNGFMVGKAAAFESTLTGDVFACTLASFIAFVVGDFANDKIFAKMKKNHSGLTNHEGFAWRAILSSFAGEVVDSCIYLPLAFLVFNPIMTVSEVFIMILLQVIIKTAYEALILPLTTRLAKKLSSYELDNRAEEYLKVMLNENLTLDLYSNEDDFDEQEFDQDYEDDDTEGY